MYLRVFYFVLSALFSTASRVKFTDPDIGWSPHEYIQRKGYFAETHYVHTPDGYITAVHRLRNPRFTGVLQPVMCVHGVLESSMTFLVGSPDGGTVKISEINYDVGQVEVIEKPSGNLGFALADQGYDVWLPNARGNTYSVNHTTMNPNKDSEFWNFSCQEIAMIDLTSWIAYIQNIAETKEIGYVGHSQGTLIVLWLLAERPEYSNILNPVVLLAPIIEFADFKAKIWETLSIEVISKGFLMSNGPIASRSNVMDESIDLFCNEKDSRICLDFFRFVGNFDSPQLNHSRVDVYTNYFPAGASRKQIAHYIQKTESKTFRYFDEGPIKNMLRYRQPNPPDVLWDRINSTTIAAFYSTDDVFSDEKSSIRLKKEIEVQLLDDYEVPYDLFSHTDFTRGIDAGTLINSRAIGIISNYFKR